MLIQCPVVHSYQNDIMRGIRLPIVNRVALNGFMNGNQSRNAGESVVANAIKRQLMVPEVKLTQRIQLVLLPVLQAIQKSIAESRLSQQPRRSSLDFAGPTPPSHLRRGNPR